MFTVSVDGLTWVFTGSDLANGVYTNYWINNGNSFVVIVQRTTDFVTWLPIATNGIGLNTIETFTDPSPPPNQAFYRIGY